MAATAERNEHKRNEGAAPLRLLGAGPRRWRWLALGGALMVLGAVAVAAALGQAEDRSGVVAAARDLPAGHVVAEGDLQVVEIAGAEQVAAIPAGRIGGLVGRTVLAPVGRDALITPRAVGGGEDHPEDGEAVVGASLADNQVPAALQSGSRVALVITASGGAEQSGEGGQETGAASAAPSISPPQEAIDGRVQSVDPPGDQSGGRSTRVALVVDAADAEVVARAASADALTVVEVAGGGG